MAMDNEEKIKLEAENERLRERERFLIKRLRLCLDQAELVVCRLRDIEQRMLGTEGK